MISRGTRERLRGIRTMGFEMRLPTYPLPRRERDSLPSSLRPQLSLENGVEIETPLGTYWQCDIELSLLWPEAIPGVERLLKDRKQDAIPTGFHPACEVANDLVAPEGKKGILRKGQVAAPCGPTEQGRQSFREAFPQRTLFLDLETCGFAGSPIFLAGVVRWEARASRMGNSALKTEIVPPSSLDMLSRKDEGETTSLLLTQLWARNYGEEPALLWGLHQLFSDAKVLVTFNGKSFDWPQVVDRSTRHAGVFRLPRPEWQHWDLLHASRRAYKTILPNCRLQTLERLICGRARHDDLPSHEVPQAYQQYVIRGGSNEVDRILQHNAMDLVTLLDLSLRLR